MYVLWGLLGRMLCVYDSLPHFTLYLFYFLDYYV